MQDLYAKMVELCANLTEVDRDIVALAAKRTAIQDAIDGLARELVSRTGSKIIEDDDDDDDHGEEFTAPHLPPRRLRLLEFLYRNPHAGYGEMSEAMYGRDDRGARSALAAEFSHLRKDGWVEAQDRGQFVLTALAKRVMNGGGR